MNNKAVGFTCEIMNDLMALHHNFSTYFNLFLPFSPTYMWTSLSIFIFYFKLRTKIKII